MESVADAQKAGKQLLELGSQMAIITMGEQGAVICTKQGQCEHVAIDQIATVCDSTGAGDSFVGTLAVLMGQKAGMSLPEQVKRACRVASQSVEKKGTQSSYPSKDELRFALFD